jgi:hypothetical protein
MNPIEVISESQNTPAVLGENAAGGDGIVGKGNRGVVGESDQGPSAKTCLFTCAIASGNRPLWTYQRAVSGISGIPQNL